MAIYTLSTSANLYTDLVNMAGADSNLTLEYSDGVDDLIIKHNGLNIYLQFQDTDNDGADIFIGKSWTAGATLDDGYQVVDSSLKEMVSGKIVVGVDYITITQFYTTADYNVIFIGELTNNDVCCIGGNGSSTTYYWAKSYNITKAEPCTPFRVYPVVSAGFDGNYGMLPLYLIGSSDVYSDGAGAFYSMKKIKVLLRAANTTLPIENIGTDLIINASEDFSERDISSACLIGEGLYQ